MLMLPLAPPKPPFGAPCNGCGYCCQQGLCQLGEMIFGAVAPPCPALLFVQGRYWCSLVLMEYATRRHDASVPPVLEHSLAIGWGCDAETDEEVAARASPGDTQ